MGPRDLRPAFFVRCRLPRWQGPLADVNEHRLLPLYSPTAIRGAFRMGHDARANDRIHRYLVERAGRVLAEHPLVNEHWRGDGAPSTTRPCMVPATSDGCAGPAAQDERRRVLLELLEANPANPLFEVVDPAGLRDAIERLEDQRPREHVQVMGAMAALIWLGGMERRRRVGSD